MTNKPKTGQPCTCKRGVQRDNCPQCEGTGQRIDFAAIRARAATPKTTFTPGPYHVGHNGDNCAVNHAICTGSRVIAKVYGNGYPAGEGWSPESEATAHLFAAAPDLLLACEAAVEFIGTRFYAGRDNGKVYGQLVAALAKAKGEF